MKKARRRSRCRERGEIERAIRVGFKGGNQTGSPDRLHRGHL